MDYSDMNNTELYQLARSRGYSIPALGWDRDEIIKALTNNLPIPNNKTNLIDQHRWAIVDWAGRRWDKVSNQILCPLNNDGGCWNCTDFRVVNCLTNNSHIFDIKEENPMAKIRWSDVIRLVSEKKSEDAATMLNTLTDADLVDNRPTRSALSKLIKAVLDLKEGNVKPPNAYYEMREVPSQVMEFMKDLSAQEIVARLIDLLRSKGQDNTTSDVDPLVKDDQSSEDDQLHDEGHEIEGYYPGIELEEDIKPGIGKDACAFLKTKPEPKPEPKPEAKIVNNLTKSDEKLVNNKTAHHQESKNDSPKNDFNLKIANALRTIGQGIIQLAEAFSTIENSGTRS